MDDLKPREPLEQYIYEWYVSTTSSDYARLDDKSISSLAKELAAWQTRADIPELTAHILERFDVSPK